MGNKRVPELRFAGVAGDWERRKLGQLIKISSAARVHKNEWTTSGVRFFRSSDVVSSFIGKKNIPAYISYSLYDELSKKSGLVQPGDLLVTGGGSIGIPYLVTDQEPLYFKDADLIWFKSANKIDGYFLYYYFVTSQLRKYISSITHIGTISHYTIEQAKDTPIVLPKQVEQNLIGNLFKQLDDTIALHQQELTTLKQTKQGFLQKMFPKEGESVPEVRFPGFDGEWEERKLNKVFKDFIVPMRDKPKEFSGTVPWTRIEDIEGRFINGTTSGQYVSEETIRSMNLKIIPKGSLIVSSSATFGVVAIVNNDLITNQTFIGLVPNTNYNIYYLYAFFKSSEIQKKMKRESAGSTIFYISRKQFEDMVGKFPNLEEQEKIGEFFKKLDDTIALHQRELDALKETKKAFLQKMFV
ncbi:hypothetical protein D2M30_0658 [Bacillus amyloliquefaciens]|uniref:restriction endonuclease subunit S n=1 Tax=Bacillus amyloliquefaciens TaxID=1390 RepID=UPI0010C3749E|nr:restriction endonuclease subunit S [Bacillus amyloliquefaciens]QBG55009.1 hypothetical protein D2M30_0658 [Bacillus amyloliquefaciens]